MDENPKTLRLTSHVPKRNRKKIANACVLESQRFMPVSAGHAGEAGGIETLLQRGGPLPHSMRQGKWSPRYLAVM